MFAVKAHNYHINRRKKITTLQFCNQTVLQESLLIKKNRIQQDLICHLIP